VTRKNIDEHINDIRPNRKNLRLKAGYNSAQSGLFDNLQLSSMKQYESETYEGKTEFFATVLRVTIKKGPNPDSPELSIRARIPEVHAHLPMPKGSLDNKVIDMYPEFTAEKSDQFSGLKVGQIVRVTHLDRHQTSLRYNNGRLLELVGAGGSVSGFSSQANKNVNAGSKRSRLDVLSSFSCPPRNPQINASAGSRLPNSKNLEKKISERNPRTINRSSDLSTFPESGYSTGGCSDNEVPLSPEVLGTPQNGNPDAGPEGINSGQPNRSGGRIDSAGTPGVPNSIECSKVYTVKQTILELPPPVTQPFDFSITKVDKTWSTYNDRIIRTLHPKIRPLVAYFINTAYKQGYKLRITSGFRSMAKQSRIRRRRLLDPNGPINGPLKPGSPATAVPGSSPHNFGLAVDVSEVPSPATGGKAGKMDCSNGYPRERWYEIGKIGLKCGFESWGGTYSKWDPVHFHNKFRNSTYKLKKKFEKGKVFTENGQTYVDID